MSAAPAHGAARAGDAEAGRARNAAPTLAAFLVLALELVLLERVLVWFDLETRTLRFVARAAFALFAVHWWLPYRWKEPALVVAALALPPLLFQPRTGFLLLGFGVLLFAACAAPLAYRLRVALAVGLLTLALALRMDWVGGFAGVPEQLWPLFGGVFGLRAFGYLYDMRRAERMDAVAFGAFFFQLPNYAFPFYPVVDYETMRTTRYRRPAGEVAQQGVHWIARGVLHLLMYRLLYHHALPASTADVITSPAKLAQVVVVTYLLYLRLSGQFHVAIGMMKLFGYDLPETHRRYLLASSLTDFWRRINIYWKDLMVKLVYFPLVFRMRRGAAPERRAAVELRAALLATLAVFLVTWLAHAYVKLWWSPAWPFTGPDAAFWGVLGVLVAVNVAVELRAATPAARLRKATLGNPPRGPGAHALHAAKVAGTFSLIAFLWYLWQRPTLADWWELVTWWRIG